jgi:hypothetical protein
MPDLPVRLSSHKQDHAFASRSVPIGLSRGRNIRMAEGPGYVVHSFAAAWRSSCALISPPTSTAKPVRYSQKIRMATPAKVPYVFP